MEIHANRQANKDLELPKETQDTGDAKTGLLTGQNGKKAMRSSPETACKQRLPKNMAVNGYVCERARVRVCDRQSGRKTRGQTKTKVSQKQSDNRNKIF
jgi:hypothetical protein